MLLSYFLLLSSLKMALCSIFFALTLQMLLLLHSSCNRQPTFCNFLFFNETAAGFTFQVLFSSQRLRFYYRSICHIAICNCNYLAERCKNPNLPHFILVGLRVSVIIVTLHCLARLVLHQVERTVLHARLASAFIYCSGYRSILLFETLTSSCHCIVFNLCKVLLVHLKRYSYYPSFSKLTASISLPSVESSAVFFLT